MSSSEAPANWKNFDDFASGIVTNRLPRTIALATAKFEFAFDDGRELKLQFGDPVLVNWDDNHSQGIDNYEAICVAPDTYFVDLTFAKTAKEAETIIFNTKSGRVLSIRSEVREAGAHPGEPRVAQIFRVGAIVDPTLSPSGFVPCPSRDLIGLRAHYTYSPNHVYEHTYLSSERYAWQCLVGVQRGHGDVDLTTTYKFSEDQYIFTFREFIIPVASTFFYNFKDERSTGKFLGVTGAGNIENSPAGAYIRKVSTTEYLAGQEPV